MMRPAARPPLCLSVRLSEYEAKVLLPAVVEKAGHNQDKIKADHREVLRRACAMYPPVKVVAFVKVRCRRCCGAEKRHCGTCRWDLLLGPGRRCRRHDRAPDVL